MRAIIMAGLLSAVPAAAYAQTSPEIEACQASGLIALKERNPGIKTVSFDAVSLSVSKADTAVGDTKIKTIIMGDATIETAKADKPRHFVCLIGEKGKVVLTFFTQS